MLGAATTEVMAYYGRYYPCEEVCALYGRSWSGSDQMPQRELCVEDDEDQYIRWQAVGGPEELRELFHRLNAHKFHMGAVYTTPLKRQKTARDRVSALRELVVEIDVNDYPLSGADEKHLPSCDRAWPLVAFGMMVVKHVLKKRFSFRHFLLAYSGRRGAHLTVHDERACELTDEERATIVQYLQPGGKRTEGGRLEYGNLFKDCHTGELWETQVRPFWTNLCLKPESEGGFGMLDGTLDRERFLELLGGWHAKCARLTLQLSRCATGLEAWEEVVAWAKGRMDAEDSQYALKLTVLAYVWPRLDVNVSKQRNHLSKAVFSLHPKTGRLCVPIKGDPSRFDPSKCPTLLQVVTGDPATTTRFHEGRKQLCALRRDLESSQADKEHRLNKKRREETATVYFMAGGAEKCQCEPSGIDRVDTRNGRLCYNLYRTFVARARHSSDKAVVLSWFTEPCSPDGWEDAVDLIPAGYAPPTRHSLKLPYADFRQGILAAQRTPGKDVVCCRAYCCMVLDPQQHDEQRARRNLVTDVRAQLVTMQTLTTVNPEWDAPTIDSYLASTVKDVYEVTHVAAPRDPRGLPPPRPAPSAVCRHAVEPPDEDLWGYQAVRAGPYGPEGAC